MDRFKNIKLVVSDMDGTLLNSDHEISDETIEVISLLEKQDIPVVIASGRTYQLLKPYFDDLKIKNPYILSNGGEISLPYSDKPLFATYLESYDALQVLEYCEANHLEYLVYTRNVIFSDDNSRAKFFNKLNEKLEPHQRTIVQDMLNHKELVNNFKIMKILIVEPNEEVLLGTIKEISVMGDFEISRSQKAYIDINPKGTTKGSALRFLADYYEITLDNIIAFGDQDNDITLLREAGIGVCMENGSAKAKDVADFITKTNDENGLAYFIRKNILK